METSEIERIAILNAIKHGNRADFGAVLSKVVGSDKSMLKDMENTKKIVLEVVNRVNSLGEEEIKRLGEGIPVQENKEEKPYELKPLPDTEKGVVLRLPPEPSGYMHLGHAISGMINYLYKQKYNGTLWLRFEDTNPNKVRSEFFDSFRSGYSWLGIKWDKEMVLSDSMDKIYSFAERLIKEGKAYACECSLETIKENRIKGVECKCRSNSIEYNLSRFKDAKEGKIEPGKLVIRFKGNMKSRDLSLRDPSLLRIIKTDYKPYRLWPLYDFASVIGDNICGVTHILRSNEFKTSLQNALREALGFQKPVVIQFSRYNFVGTPFSKRKIRALIENGYIKDWNDLRLPTISAIKRRGIQPEAIKEFVLRAGYSESKHEYSWDVLLTLNRRLIDAKARRFFFVESPVRLHVQDAPEVIAKLRNHPSEDLGQRMIKTNGEFYISKVDADELHENEDIRLKDLYSIKIDKITNEEIFAKTETKSEGKIIQWVASGEETDAKIIKIGPLLVNDEFNPDSLVETNGLAEKGVKNLKEGEIIQFERFGFCILDRSDPLSFVFISK